MNLNDIVIVRSPRRRKTIQSKYKDGKFYVYLPAGMSSKNEEKWIEQMKKLHERREKRKKLNSDGALMKRAQELNKRFFGGVLTFDIKFVTNQNSRFGSCSSRKKIIRLSDRLSEMPRWVQDYVIIHELAHLIHPDHSKRFWEKVHQYRYTERARGYLIAVGMTSDDES